MRKRAGVTYTEYPDSTLFFVGYKEGSERTLIETHGMAVVGHSTEPPYEPDHIACRFVQTEELYMHTHSRDGIELDPEDCDYYDVGIAIGPTPGEAYLDRVWFPSNVSRDSGFKGVIEGYERFMLDGYTSQEDLETAISQIGRKAGLS